nr:hypothetical protein [Tanacetum cinerariifolium]
MAVTQITNNISIRSILGKEKLNGSNFLDWYHNLRIVLKNEQKFHHLEKALPKAPPIIVGRNAYTHRVVEQQEVGCLMLVSMTLEIQKNLEDRTASEILQEMKTMFQQQAKQELFETITAFHAYQMDQLGCPMPLVHEVNLILTSLSKYYDEFIQNYNIHGMGKTIPELHAMLKLAEKSIHNKAPAVLAIRQELKKNKASTSGTSDIFTIELFLFPKNNIVLPYERISLNIHLSSIRFPLLRSARIPQELKRYGSYIDVEEHELRDYGEPPNYRAALSDPKSKKSKWLFNKKTNMDGNIHTYKARLVAKGFTQTYEVDYEETFSPVVDIKAIRILIAIAAYCDYKIWQMDIGFVFVMNRFTVDWKSSTVMYSMEVEYLAAVEAAMEAIWISKFIFGLGVVPNIDKPIDMYCDNTCAITIADEPGIQKGAKHFRRKYHFIREVIQEVLLSNELIYLIIMANPLLNHDVNLPDDEQVQPEPVLALLEFIPAVLDIPNNNNGYIEEEPKEDPEMEKEEEEEEEEEMDIEDEMDDPEIINPYEIELGEMDRYFGAIGMERRSETREHRELKQSMSTLEDQMRGLMLEDKEEKERLKKKLRASQQEKEQIEQAFHHMIDWIHRQFRVEIPPCIVSRIDAIGCNDLCHFVKQCNYVLTLIMPPKAIRQAAIKRLITQRVNATLEAERASRANEGGKEAMQMKKEAKIGHLQFVNVLSQVS